MRIVFLGTPGFAVGCLKALVDGGKNIVGVVTSPDRPAGRGYKLKASEVKLFAVQQNLPVLQPEKLKDENFLAELKSWDADLFVVVAFRMLPEEVWGMPSKGTFNLHASLLPQYRGAAPINWALVNGEKKTGVTTFFLDHKIDTGEIIMQKEVAITENMNAGELHDQLMSVGSKLIIETVNAIEDGSANPAAQNADGLEIKKAPKIFKENSRIDWSDSAQAVHNLVRGMSPYPTAHCRVINPEGKELGLKVLETRLSDRDISLKNIVEENNRIFVGCGENSLEVLELQLEGKKRMDAETFLRGNKFSEYTLK
jgi:methionyl-tRNA formyltransferase